MKTLYIDCGMGAAGDMLTAALLELVPDREVFLKELNQLGIPGVEFAAEPSVKCGIGGTHMAVKVHGEEESEGMHEHHHDHEHEHHHDHDHEHEHHHDHDHEHEHHYDHDHEHEHHHDHDHEHEHHHDHDHDHEHEHEHHHDHDHDHEHEHHHDHDHEHEHEHHHDHDHDHEHAHGEHHHHHSGMHEIEHLVWDLPVSEKVKEDVLAVYGLIAQAESRAHGVPVDQIHFHEVGTMDALADVTAVCLLMERLQAEKIVVSPVHVGSGTVRCAHGILPVPAPATAYILEDVPMYGGRIKGELCTPTGAALLKHFATTFGDMPVMKTEAIGYGMGKKDFEIANCVRAMIGETQESNQMITELACNLDDMTPEAIGFAMDQFLEAGALDVYTIPVGMKKCRPGIVLVVMCRAEQKDQMIQLIFKHTMTLGIREYVSKRYTLNRRMETVNTPYGEVHRKVSSGYGTERAKWEYEDLAAIAREHQVSIREVLENINN